MDAQSNPPLDVAVRALEALPRFFQQLHAKVVELEAENTTLRASVQVLDKHRQQFSDEVTTLRNTITGHEQEFARKTRHESDISQNQHDIDAIYRILDEDRKAVRIAMRRLEARSGKPLNASRLPEQDTTISNNGGEHAQPQSSSEASSNTAVGDVEMAEAQRVLYSPLPLHLRGDVSRSSAPPTLDNVSVLPKPSMPPRPTNARKASSSNSPHQLDSHLITTSRDDSGAETTQHAMASSESTSTTCQPLDPNTLSTTAEVIDIDSEPDLPPLEPGTPRSCKKTTAADPAPDLSKVARTRPGRRQAKATTPSYYLSMYPWLDKPAPPGGRPTSKMERHAFQAMWQYYGQPGKLQDFARRCLDEGLFGFEYGNVTGNDHQEARKKPTRREMARTSDTKDANRTDVAVPAADDEWTEVLSGLSSQRRTAAGKTCEAARVPSPPGLFVNPYPDRVNILKTAEKRKRVHETLSQPETSKLAKQSTPYGVRFTSPPRSKAAKRSKGRAPETSSKPVVASQQRDELEPDTGPLVESLGFNFRPTKEAKAPGDGNKENAAEASKR